MAFEELSIVGDIAGDAQAIAELRDLWFCVKASRGEARGTLQVEMAGGEASYLA